MSIRPVEDARARGGATIRLPEPRQSEPEPFTRGEVAEDIFVAVLSEALSALTEAAVPHVLIGGLASAVHGRPRVTHDVDVLVKPAHARDALSALAAAGFETQQTNDYWLYKGFKNGVLIDIIFRLRGEIYLDDEMYARRVASTYKGVPIHAVAPEDLFVVKAITYDEENPHHLHDAVATLVGARAIDWDYLVERAAAGMRRVLSALIFAQSCDVVVPDQVVRTLFERAYPA